MNPSCSLLVATESKGRWPNACISANHGGAWIKLLAPGSALAIVTTRGMIQLMKDVHLAYTL